MDAAAVSVSGHCLLAPSSLVHWSFIRTECFPRHQCLPIQADKDVLQVVSQLLGKTPGTLLAISYWMGIYPVVLIYAISITNTVDSFIVNQLNGPEINRTILSIVCVGILTGAAFALGRKPMLWLSNALVYPLIISLATVSIYLIPHWDFSGFYETSTFHPWDFLKSLFLIMPVLIFSFSHEAAMSQFSLDMKKSYGANAEKQVSRVGRITVFLLVFFTMFFVWSCVLSMGADGIKTATEQNIPVLSYFANTANAPFMVWISPIIVLAPSSPHTSATCLVPKKAPNS